MAHFSGKQNLLGFKGSKLLTNINQERPQMVYVCIPVVWNDIELSRDGQRADVRIYLEETSDKYRQSCIQHRQMSGEPMDGYLPPSHTLEARFSKEFREKALEAARRRLLTEHPEWTGDDLSDPLRNRDLRNAMYDAVRVRLGSVYLAQRSGQQSAAPSATPHYGQAAQGAKQWAPPQGDPITGQPIGSGYDASDDDLPF